MQCLVALSKMETDKMMYILFEETTARNGSHPDMLSKPLTEMQVILRIMESVNPAVLVDNGRI